MNEIRDRKEDLIARVRTERDHLKVRMHLAGTELREEWDEVEKKWQKLETKLATAKKGARETSEEVRSAMSVVGQEISEAYRRIRNRLD